MTPSLQQTRDQQRAKHAMQVVGVIVNDLKRLSEDKKLPDEKRLEELKKRLAEAKKFGGQARKLPTRIVASGLGQALAFLKAKGYTPELLVAVADWVIHKPADGFNRPGAKPKDDELLKAVILGTSDYLRQATAEALAYLQWLNRFCEANDLSSETETK